MEIINEIREINLQEINTASIILRLFMATMFGGLIGVERTRKQRAAGFRTYILVCIGSALAMMTNQYIGQELNIIGDPSRMGAQVISGIGFLGAGTILVTKRQEIKGLTTAAGLWASACMGLAIGIGFYEGAIIGFAYIWGVMTVLQFVDKACYKHSKRVKLYIEIENIEYFEPIINHLTENHEKIYETQVIKGRNTLNPNVGILMTIKIGGRRNEVDIVEEIKQLNGVQVVEEL